MSVTVEQMQQAAAALGMHPTGILNRLNQGWSEEKALTTPRYARSTKQEKTTRRCTTTTTKTSTTPSSFIVEPGTRVIIDMAQGTVVVERTATE